VRNPQVTLVAIVRCSSRSSVSEKPCLSVCLSSEIGNLHDPGSLLEHIVTTMGTEIIVKHCYATVRTEAVVGTDCCNSGNQSTPFQSCYFGYHEYLENPCVGNSYPAAQPQWGFFRNDIITVSDRRQTPRHSQRSSSSSITSGLGPTGSFRDSCQVNSHV
jgi:hypothetical protein